MDKKFTNKRNYKNFNITKDNDFINKRSLLSFGLSNELKYKIKEKFISPLINSSFLIITSKRLFLLGEIISKTLSFVKKETGNFYNITSTKNTYHNTTLNLDFELKSYDEFYPIYKVVLEFIMGYGGMDFRADR